MNRYYIKFVTFNNYMLIDRFYNEVVTRGTLDDVNKAADALGDCDESIEY